MTKLTRRNLLLSAAGTSALGLGGSLAWLSPAQAADLRGKGHYSYQVGDMEVIAIYDGIWELPHEAGAAVGVSPDQTRAALREADLDDAFIPVEFAFTVIKRGEQTILIDAGTGQDMPLGGLGPRSLAAAGIAPEAVDVVLMSHLHPDHFFGLMQKGSNAQMFPNAEILIGETEYAFWTDPSIIETLPERRRPSTQRLQDTFPTWKNITLFNGETEVLPGIRSIFTPGHTPGHMVFHLSSGEDQLMILGDTVIVPALFLTHLDWQLAFDADGDLASETRRALIDRVVADGIPISGYHFGFPNSGRIIRDGSGFVFDPVARA